jgi:hypothetical protein
MTVWIQRHDFSSRDLDDTTVDGALGQFEITDWAAEDQLATEKENAGEEFCSAGIGFIHPSGSILHLCPDGSDRMMIHYHYPIAKRILGLFPTLKQETVTLESVPGTEAESLIRLHYSNNSDAILEAAKRIEQAGSYNGG